jgi:hypothetical protein
MIPNVVLVEDKASGIQLIHLSAPLSVIDRPHIFGPPTGTSPCCPISQVLSGERCICMRWSRGRQTSWIPSCKGAPCVTTCYKVWDGFTLRLWGASTYL